MHLHAAAADARANPERFLAGEESRAHGRPAYLHSVKVAFEAPRFWETDDNIFGGLAWTDRLNENVIYPSRRVRRSPKACIVGAYCAGWTDQDTPDTFAALSHEERLRDQPRVDRGAAPGPVASARQRR